MTAGCHRSQPSRATSRPHASWDQSAAARPPMLTMPTRRRARQMRFVGSRRRRRGQSLLHWGLPPSLPSRCRLSELRRPPKWQQRAAMTHPTPTRHQGCRATSAPRARSASPHARGRPRRLTLIGAEGRSRSSRLARGRYYPAASQLASRTRSLLPPTVACGARVRSPIWRHSPRRMWRGWQRRRHAPRTQPGWRHAPRLPPKLTPMAHRLHAHACVTRRKERGNVGRGIDGGRTRCPLPRPLCRQRRR